MKPKRRINYNTAVAAIVEDKGKILVGKKIKGNHFLSQTWHLPGGKHNNGEAEEEAIIREIKEEAGIEIKIKRKHILILNGDKKMEEIKTFGDLSDYKKRNPRIFVLAPHPFVFSYKSLGSKLLKNIDLFDAIELTVFSNKIFNFNKKAEITAKKYQKPLIATSDTHSLKDLNRGYALINTEMKNAESIFASIKKGNFQNNLNSMGIFAMAEIQIKFKFYSVFKPSKSAL